MRESSEQGQSQGRTCTCFLRQDKVNQTSEAGTALASVTYENIVLVVGWLLSFPFRLLNFTWYV